MLSEGHQINVSKEDAKIRLTWEATDAKDVEKARAFFARLTKQGWLPTLVGRKDKLRRVLEFKPEYGELYFIPLSEGG